MKRSLGTFTFAAIIAVLIGLIGDVISDDISVWLSMLLGPNAFVFLIILLLCLVGVSVWVNYKSLGKNTDAPLGANLPQEQFRSPTLEEFQHIEPFEIAQTLIERAKIRHALKWREEVSEDLVRASTLSREMNINWLYEKVARTALALGVEL